MVEFHVKTPIPPEELKKIKIGDIVYVTGTIVTARVAAPLKTPKIH